MVQIHSITRTTIAAAVIAVFISTFGGVKVHAATVYWNLFNIEGENTVGAQFATYATLNDMLTNTNRTNLINPSTSKNLIGSGAFFTPDMPVVPVPAAVWMFLSALSGLWVFGWRCRRATSQKVA